MNFYMKLPRNKKEFLIFMLIISVISVNIIASLITCFEVGFHFDIWMDVLKVLPFIWMAVIIFVLLIHKPAEWLTRHIIDKDDSFNAHIIVNVLCNVFLMSIFLTIIGTWIDTRHISMEPIINFFYIWPRNFAIAFRIELLIAQPIARFIIFRIHKYIDSKSNKSKSETKRTK